MNTMLKQLTAILRVTLPPILLLILLSLNSTAQWTTSGTNIYNSNTGNVGIGTTAPASKFNVIGESRFGASGNYVKVSSTGVFSFTGSGNYTVANNKYVFKQNSSGNRGFLVDQTYKRFEFTDSSSNDLFHVDYYKGDGYFKGKLGIGTTSVPDESNLALGGHSSTEGGQLQLNSPTIGGDTAAWLLDVHEDDFRIARGDNSGSINATGFFIDQDGKVGIATTNPTAYLTVYDAYSGAIGTYTSSGWQSSSDERLKTNIKPLENALDKILKLQGVSYNWKAMPDSLNQIGFIAQDVEKIFPEVAVQTSDGYYVMAQQNLVAPVVEAIKIQQKEIEGKDSTIKILQSVVSNLQNKNAFLTSQLDTSENALSQCCMSFKSGTLGSELTSSGDIAKLEQNSPNPFSGNTTIRCYIPQGASQAVIKIYSLAGEALISLPVNDKGINQLEISAGTLSFGTYNYLLIVDGKAIDTKQMILTK